MSDQINKNMARKIYDAQKNYDAPGLCSGWERFLGACKGAGLIKPSKLDEARVWVRKNEYARGSEETHRSYAAGVRDCASHFEAAITEILEERE